MIRITNYADCCGCTACASICAHKAITMKADALGFFYPEVDETKCVECGLCETVCEFHPHYDLSDNLPEPEAYVGRHKDIEHVHKSQSGAAFIPISDYILNLGGVIYGAGFDKLFRVTHKRALTTQERDEFRGSKYVQSDLNGVFQQVKQDLKAGKTVLFSGTPCQTAGLKSFVGKRMRENLVLVDLVCHGVGAPNLWRDYLDLLERRQKDKLCAVTFRDKKYGWQSHVETLHFTHGKTMGKRIFATLYAWRFALRKSCGICPYCNTRRPSDLTIADFWGKDNAATKFCQDNKGCSMVFVNTEKGRTIWDTIRKEHPFKLIPAENCIQPNLLQPTVLPSQSEQFEKDYVTLGLEAALRNYGLAGWHLRLRETGRILRESFFRMIPRSVKNQIKRKLTSK